GACSPGHLGSNEIAFLRDGHLWTIDPDGANAFEIVADTVPVVGYTWSPTHQILMYRTLDPDFARTTAAKHILTQPVTQLVGDLPSTLNTIGIDGGNAIPIQFSDSAVQYSNAWWNTSGNRLLYREESANASQTPNSVLWWVSQNDQPGGIARKPLPGSFSIPSIAPDNSMAIGNSNQGLFTTALTGTNLHYLVRGTLPGHPLIATLERVLWQPAHSQPALLYAIASSPGQSGSFGTSANIELVLRDMHGQMTTVTTCACVQFAWSPDGNHILYSSGSTYTLFNSNDHTSFSFSTSRESVPYWSPDSQFLLLDSLHKLTLIRIASHQQEVLLSDNSQSPTQQQGSGSEVSINALLQPISNSPWASDSRHFLFLTRGRSSWQGSSLHFGSGLYTVSINDAGKPQGTPALIDAGNDSQPGWTYEDPATSFIY
ncbi:MAG: hypothetical protein ACJ8BW_31450, partial [Ktedonobacteraceae bacterium]